MLAHYDAQHEPGPGATIRFYHYTSGLQPGVQHYDFVERPELIREVLEDFVPHARWPAVQRLYDLIEWINARDSVFESNDSRLTGVRPSLNSPGFGKQLECVSGIMIFLRRHELNASADHVNWYVGRLLEVLRGQDGAFRSGVITATFFPISFEHLPEASRLGREVLLTCWAFGGSEEETMGNLDRCYRNLAEGLSHVASEIATALRLAKG